MKITICIGSACHMKGSRRIVEQMQDLILEHGLIDKIDLCGRLCNGNCYKGVCVTIDNELFTVHPDHVQSFFENHVLPTFEK